MLDDIDARIEAAVEKAEASPFDQLTLPARWSAPRRPSWEPLKFEPERIVHSVKRGLGEALQSSDDVVLIGEDIESPYGGAFKATMDLSHEHPGRVRNTPISELSLAGVGNGLALGGFKPIVEFMFGDFTMLAADQWVNHAGKFRFMFNDKVRMPVILRTPMGGKRGYASTHSQSLEKHLLGLPDTQALCLHHRYSPARLYADLIETIDRPTLVIENKILYGQHCSSDAPPGFSLLREAGEAFPMVRLKPHAPADVTICALGGMATEAEKALLRLFEEEEIVGDLFLPTRLYPFDVDALLDSVEATRRLVIVEEGQGFVSLSSEIIAQFAERYPQFGVAFRRVTAAPVPIPAARPLEEQCLPGARDIVELVVEVANVLIH